MSKLELRVAGLSGDGRVRRRESAKGNGERSSNAPKPPAYDPDSLISHIKTTQLKCTWGMDELGLTR